MNGTVTINSKTGPNLPVNTTVRGVSSILIDWGKNTLEINYSDGESLICAIDETVSFVTTNGVDTFTLS